MLVTGGFRPWLQLLKTFLERTLYISVEMFPHSVQFDYVHRGCTLEVDLLVSPYWNNQKEFYSFLKSVPVHKQPM